MREVLNNKDISDQAFDEFIKSLVESSRETSPYSENYSIIEEADSHLNTLDKAYKMLSKSDEKRKIASSGVEWFLDNYFVIQKAIELIRDDLPNVYFNILPGLKNHQSLPRVYYLAQHIIAYYQIELSQNDLHEFLSAFQAEISLKMSELWALPLLLRLVLVEILAGTIFKLVEGEQHDQVLTKFEHRNLDSNEIIARSLRTLIFFDRMDWKVLFEAQSNVEKILKKDPLEIYQDMDFETRDAYRKKIEYLAKHSDLEEANVAQTAVDLASQPKTSDLKTRHVGFYLMGDGLKRLQQEINFFEDFTGKLHQFFFDHNEPFFLGSIAIVTAIVVFGLITAAQRVTTSVWQLILIGIVSFIPASSVAVNLINSILTTTIPPTTLPKMDFRKGIPRAFRTVVVIPALFSSQDELESLLQQLELHYLANKDRNIGFVLLTDFGDAPQENMPEDDVFMQAIINGINDLNETYRGDDGRRPFYLFHRLRQWNPQEDVWMGWERKRGKLADFNRFLIEGFVDSFETIIGDLEFMDKVRYVITLDADTVLPRDSAKALIATMAHPLNQAEFDQQTSKVTHGYTILQPRTEVKPTSVIKSFFTRVFAGDLGLDLYTRAVSDVYQDLFGEGIFVGKGIYDVAAFHRSLENKVPQNSLLSHDLFEGLQGRAGLVTDVVFYEDYPPDYASHVNRLHRWVRGDWQLLPWLFPRVPTSGDEPESNSFSAIDIWKIVDNLRRSLLAPTTLFSLVVGWLLFHQQAWIWTMLILFVSAFPLINSIVSSFSSRFLKGAKANVFSNIRTAFFRWAFWLIFLPFESLLMIDAIVTTLVRIYISHKRLLQWQTSAHTIRVFGRHRKISTIWQRMIGGPLISMVIGLLLFVINPTALWSALPIILLWLFSPQIAYWISTIKEYRAVEPLSEKDLQKLRQLARQTWLYFERFVGPDDHWLPPDHFQEDPKGTVAHRTSPTNIGLMLLSTAVAYDFGYIGVFDFIYRMTYSFESLNEMEKYRGHLLNWYDTRSLEALSPRYVSTVDSGNYATSLIGLYQTLKEIPDHRICPSSLLIGASDSLGVLSQIVHAIKSDALVEEVESLFMHCLSIQAELQQPILSDTQQLEILTEIREQLLQRMQALISQFPEIDETVSAEVIKDLRYWAESIFNHLENTKKQIEILAPWIHTWQTRPPFIDGMQSYQLLEIFKPWYKGHTLKTTLARIPEFCDQTIKSLKEYLDMNKDPGLDALEEDQIHDLKTWLGRFIQDLQQSKTNVLELFDQISGLEKDIEFHLERMEFGFLFDHQREVFYLGYQMDSGRLDKNHYDLLASEARTASLYAIAQNEVPRSHWLHMARPFTSVGGIPTLISWNGSMFEYLMPNLFTRAYPETLLHQTSLGAVQAQIDYGRQKKVPWGISESAFYQIDQADNYQYRGFGVPSLGRKRGLANDLVVAPYASLLAVNVKPCAVLQNIENLEKEGLLGHFGFYDSVDYTKSRLPLGQEKAIIKSFYAHHQGMILVALGNYLNPKPIVDRIHTDPRIKSTDLLLQEQIPQAETEQTTVDLHVSTVGQKGVGIAITPWTPDIGQPGREIHTLSNGSMKILMSDSGSGYLGWKDIALTRWKPDDVMDINGIWFFVQDLDQGQAWSIGRRPIDGQPKEYQVIYSAHMLEIRKAINETWMTMQTTIMPDMDVCLQKIKIINQSDRVRRYRVISYGEVVLAPQASDQQHPAFNKLFIESTFDDNLKMLHFQRRLRSSFEEPRGMAHLLYDNVPGKIEYTTDREAFIGRGLDLTNPITITEKRALSNIVGITLDPIFSIGKYISLKPNQSADLTFMTIAAPYAEEAQSIAKNMRSEIKIDNAFTASKAHNEKLLRAMHLGSDQLAVFQRLLSYVLYPVPQLRAETEVLIKNELGQSGLWAFGVSGDYPILLVMINDKDELEALQEILLAHDYWRKMAMMIDLVVLNTKDTGYTQELNDRIYQAINVMEAQNWLNRRGGIFVLTASQMDIKPLRLLKSAASVVFDLNSGDLISFLESAKALKPHLPAFVPTSPEKDFDVKQTIKRPYDLLFDNDIGGFTKDGREYQIFLNDYLKNPGEDAKITPAPWANVIANQAFGFLVTESGGGYTWSMNSGENRLTPWTNDPVSDPAGECLYLRDEINGKVWSPTPYPAGVGVDCLVRQGQGYTIFESINAGFRSHLKLFVDAEQPVKIVELTLTNLAEDRRRLTGTYFVEWVLNPNREKSKAFIIPTFDHESGSLMAFNPYSAEFSERVAFLTSDHPVHGLTTDRREFLGLPGNRHLPAALKRVGLSNRVSAGMDPCAALQVHLNFEPGEEQKAIFILGQGSDEKEARRLAEIFSQPEMVAESFPKVIEKWDGFLNTIQVETPSLETDLILNRWLLYQTLTSRLWGRSGFYQSSGAYGFRDQLQDVLSTMDINPEISRQHILRASAHQFDAGDVLHWWHSPSGRGVRTRITDDLLWLVYVTAEYVKVTGDISILSEVVPFKIGAPLEKDEDERYAYYESSEQTFTIFEHCRRALDRGDTQGPHGLPLIGGGDWNDGMNRVGIGGKGESVWLGWFLYENHLRFADLCEMMNEPMLAQVHYKRAEELKEVINQTAWDGSWFLRAFYDDGTPLGSQQNEECRIDSLPQSWSILTQGASVEHQNMAIRAVEDHLVQKDHRLIQLFTPPFNHTKKDPGYIKGYPPGIRENGGQYTHAAIWAVWAMAKLGMGDKAFEGFSIINPINHSKNLLQANQYRVEPYVVAADIYSTEPFIGRGGWTWYTGSSAWLYRLGVEAILGFKRCGDHFVINPCIPAAWDEYKMSYKANGKIYKIVVRNPDHVQKGVKSVRLDGNTLPSGKITLNIEHTEHVVEVIMGESDETN